MRKKTATLPQNFTLAELNDTLVAQLLPIDDVDVNSNNNIASSELVSATATDSSDLTGELTYALRIEELDSIAVIDGTLPDALVSELYEETLGIANSEGRFSLYDGPEGLSLSSTGLVKWAPTPDQLGRHTIRYVLQDLSNTSQTSTIRETFITVTNGTNQPPAFSSTPLGLITEGDAYSYQAVATDPEGTAVTYALISGPADASMDSNGLLSWNPTVVGSYDFVVRAIDADNTFADQAFTVVVNNANNTPPSITSTPSNSAGLNRDYAYQMVVVDDSPVLTYSLVQAPTGLSLDQNGLVAWTPDTLGEYTVIARVEDGEFFLEQEWIITVRDVGSELSGEITLTGSTIGLNQQQLITVVPSGIVGNVDVTATLNGNPLSLNNAFQALVLADTLGNFTVEATITDDQDSVTVQTSYEVVDFVDDPPVVDILTPVDGGIITDFADVQIRVQDDNLQSWRLSYRNAEDDPATIPRVTLAEGTTEINDAVVATFDTSLLMNGIYVMVIEATDTNGQTSNIAHSLFLEGDLKLGHFAVAFEDMNIPVAGIPITITRGYDTRERNRDYAFGKGWSIGYQSLRLSESRIPGLGWFQDIEYFQEGPARFPRYCIRPAGQPLVSVRLPDGEVEKFRIRGRVDNPSSEDKPECQDFAPPQLFGIEFVAQGDTNSTLTSNLGQSGLSVVDGNLQVIDGFTAIDPNAYTLTTLDDTQFSLDQGFNVTGILTTEGYTLTFTEDGITHSGGMSVDFIRDTEGRITRIEKPNGEFTAYSYDTEGNLASFTDLNGNVTTFTYLADHYLEDIVDPNGIRVARNEYDADGRLIAHIDADGNRIEYDNDLVNMTSTITDRRGFATINAFDNAGNIVAQTNALGETTTYTYNDRREELSRTDALGNTTSWTYDLQGNQLTETDPLGNVTTSTYNNRAELTTQIDALGQVVITNDYIPLTTVTGPGQLRTTSDALGRVTEFHWLTDSNGTTANTGFTDSLGNRYDIQPIGSGLTGGLSGETTDLNGLITRTTYDDQARPLTETQVIEDDMGIVIAEYVTTMTYNANGDVLTTTDALGNVTTSEYDSLNRVIATVDANGNRTEYDFDDRGNQTRITYPDGSFETMVYDEENNVIEQTDREGHTTKTIYDALGRVTDVIQPDDTPLDDSDNPRTTNTYDAGGRLIGVTDANGNTIIYEYDAAGRRTKTIDALGNETVSVYDAIGRRTQSTDALGRVTTFEYNAVGNLTRTNFANGTFMSTTYDALNRKVSETDLAGLTTSYEYDAAGNLTAVIDALNQRTEYTYDRRGNKLTQTDANGNTTSWAYDALSRVISRTLPMGEVETYTYDGVGNRISMTDFNGDTTTYTYNDLNQLVTTTYADLTTVVNTYTLDGQIATITEVNGTTSYSYDEQNRLIRIDYPTGNYIEYSYDLQGNKTQTITANQTVTHTYDVLNRLSTTTDATGTTSYTYDAVGNRATQVNANGVTVSYSYDPLNRLLNMDHINASNQTIASYAYTLAPNGNRISLTEGTGRIVDYTYDDLYRLITETVTDPVNGDHYSEWAYDAVGNRLQQDRDGVITTYIYNANDHLLQETEGSQITTYMYDANGNTLNKAIDGIIDTTYTYTKDNRMLTANTPTDSMSYTYDAGGIRQSQTTNGTVTNYLVDPNRDYHQVIEELNDLQIVEVIYTYGDDLINQQRAEGDFTYGYDGLGSTRILTDTTGTVQNSYGYQAFGEQDYQIGTVPNSYLFTGEQYDHNVGFYYLRARYYNPQIGRFSQMDTFPGMQFEPKSLHKYLYTHADPINNIDPSGNVSINSLMAGTRGSLIKLKYAIAAFSRKVLNFVRKKKIFSVFVYQIARPIRDWHTYMYVEKDGTKSGLRYDVDVFADEKPIIGRAEGRVKTRNTKRSKLKGTKFKITKFSFGQNLLWHSSVVGRDANECKIRYSLSGNNCTTWTIRATAKALLIARLPI